MFFYFLCPENSTLLVPREMEKKMLYPRKPYHLGQVRISWFLERYCGLKFSSGGFIKVLDGMA